MKKTITLWDNMAKSFHKTSSKSRAHRQKYVLVAEELLKTGPETILDLGCGSGLLASELCRRGYCGQVHCYDGSDKMLEIARDFVKADNVKFSRAMIDSSFNPGQSYDAIVAINLLFYLDDKQTFMKMVAECLNNESSVFVLIAPKPGGETSNWEFVKAHFASDAGKGKVKTVFNELRNLPGYIELAVRQSKLDKLEKNGDIVFDRPEAIRKMAEAAGLTVSRVEDIHAGQNWLIEMQLV